MLTVSRVKTIGVRNRKKSNTEGLATSHIHRSCPNLKGGYYTELHTTGRSLGNHLKILPATLFTGYREGREDCNLTCIADGPKPNLSVNSVVSTCFCPPIFLLPFDFFFFLPFDFSMVVKRLQILFAESEIKRCYEFK